MLNGSVMGKLVNSKLLADGAVYVLADVLNKSLPFLLLPVLTRYLTVDSYGLISAFVMITNFAVVFVGLNMHGAINVNFFKLRTEELRVYIGNCIVLLFGSTLLALLTIVLFGSQIFEYTKIPVLWQLIAIGVVGFQFVTTINLGLWIAERKPKAYGIYQILQTLLFFLGSLLLVIGLGWGWEGHLVALFVSVASFGLISLFVMYRRGYMKFEFSHDYLKSALRFGVPLIPHALSNWAKTGVDKFLILSLLGVSVLGVYSVGFQLGMVIGILTIAFNKAWSPFLYRTISNSPDHKQRISLVRTTYLYFVSLLLLFVAFNLTVPIVFSYLIDESFSTASEYVLYISLAFTFNGMYLMVSNYILYEKKTFALSKVSMSVGIFHTAACYLLISYNGAVGAAQATALSYFLSFVFTWTLANKIHPMPWKGV